MKSLILTALVAVSAMFMGIQPASAGNCCGIKICAKKKIGTTEVCRRYFCKTRCVLGCPRTIRFVEITYCTTYCDCCGNKTSETWTRVRRCGVVKKTCCN